MKSRDGFVTYASMSVVQFARAMAALRAGR
jgi:hypothetical protein